uniref:Uncharacterized protein n=1 Tax=Arundo donax TaxID=35708 RepID=A0A0A9CLH3_ARUDO
MECCSGPTFRLEVKVLVLLVYI